MKVWLQVCPEKIVPELKLPSVAVTVWKTESLFVQTTVLFTPTTTVIVAGEYPGEFTSVAAPLIIVTCESFGD